MSAKIFQQIPKIMAEVGAIPKSRKNGAQNYSFRGIDDVYNAFQTLLAKHGVFFVPEVISSEREERQGKSGGTLIYTVLKVKYTFYADDGSSVCAVTTGEAMDSGDKSANKAMSAALKYAMLQMFCIPTEEDQDQDTENHSPEVKPKPVEKWGGARPSDAQLKRLHAIKAQSGVTDADLKSYAYATFGVESSKDLSLPQYDQLCDALARGLVNGQ